MAIPSKKARKNQENPPFKSLKQECILHCESHKRKFISLLELGYNVGLQKGRLKEMRKSRKENIVNTMD